MFQLRLFVIELCNSIDFYTFLQMFNAYFVDLFVRVSNHLAIAMYTSLGYTVYRRVLRYYSGENEDANGKKKNSRVLFFLCLVLQNVFV
jgi:ribosomal protein S18 acetylase RimI-like enzyme